MGRNDEEHALVSSDSSGDEAPAGASKPAQKSRNSRRSVIAVVVLAALALGILAACTVGSNGGGIEQPTTKGTDFAVKDGQEFDLDAHLGIEYAAVVQDIYEEAWLSAPEMKYVSVAGGIPGCPLAKDLVTSPPATRGNAAVSLREVPNMVAIYSQIVPGAKNLPESLCGRTLVIWPPGNFAAAERFTIIGGCVPHENPNASKFRQPHCVTDKANVLRISGAIRQKLENAATTPLTKTPTQYGDANSDEVDPEDPAKRQKFQYEGLSFAVY